MDLVVSDKRDYEKAISNPSDPRGFGVGAPSSYYTVGGFAFLASPGGELSLFMDGKAIVFDITFDIADSEPPAQWTVKAVAN